MIKKTYIAPEFTTVLLNNKPLLAYTSQLGTTATSGEKALGKDGGFWSDDDEPEEVDW